MSILNSVRGRLIALVMVGSLPAPMVLLFSLWTPQPIERDLVISAMAAALVGLAVATSLASKALVLRWTDQISTTARLVAGGDYKARVGGPYEVGELGALARAFDQMLDEVARREGDLQSREEWFRSVVQHSSDLIVILDRDGRFIYVSPAAEGLLGFDPKALEGRSLLDYVHPDERIRTASILKYVGNQPSRMAAVEHRLRRQSGEFVSMESIAVNLLDNPAVEGLVVNSRDVTRRRRIEEMLRLVTSAVDQSQDGVLIVRARFDAGDGSPEIVYGNPALLQLLGLREDQVIGQTPAIFCGPGVGEAVTQEMRRCMETGQDGRFETVNHGVEGQVYPMDVHVTPLKDENGAVGHFVVQCRDLTEQRRAEQERERLESALRQGLKMDAVGTLAGGIAHDFNNALLPMMMLTQLTINRLPLGSREREDLERVLAAQRRAKSLVGQILAFSRGSTGEYDDIDLRAICAETLTLLRASLPSTIALNERLEGAPLVHADPTQIQQVVMNLCSNAAQAMPGRKGVIEVALEVEPLYGAALPTGLEPGVYCRLTVADDGVGIAPEIIERIFDPFFTTKEVGVGTGLGLSVVHGIVMAHKGAITVDSRLGHGTSVTIHLPALQQQPRALESAA